MAKLKVKKWIFAGIIVAAITIPPFALIPVFKILQSQSSKSWWFEGQKFNSEKDLKQFIENKYGIQKVISSINQYKYDNQSSQNQQNIISYQDLQKINNEILNNITSCSVLANNEQVKNNLYGNENDGRINPNWFREVAIYGDEPINIYRANNDVITTNKDEALMSFISSEEVYYFDNLYFKTKQDLQSYLRVSYFRNPENQNKKNDAVVIIGPNGIKSRQITLNENGNWIEAASSFISDNHQTIIKSPNNNTYLNADNKQFIQDNITIDDVNYYQIMHNNTNSSSSSSSTWVVGTNLLDSYDFTGKSFYQGDNQDFDFNFIDKINWTKLRNNSINNIDQSLINSNNYSINSLLSKYFNDGAIFIENNQVFCDYPYLLGATNSDQKLISLYNNAVTNYDYHNYISSNIEFNSINRQRINLTQSAFISHQAISNTFIDEMNKALLSYFNRSENQPFKEVYEDAITVANSYRTNKNYCILFRVPLLYYYIMNQLMQRHAPNDLLDVVRFYFKSIAEIMTNILEMKLGESALEPIIGAKKLNLVEVYGFDQKVIDFNLNKLERYFFDNYPALSISAAMVESTSLAVQDGVFPSNEQIQNNVDLMIEMLHPDIEQNYRNRLKDQVVNSVKYQLETSNNLLSNDAILSKMNNSIETTAAFVMVEVENQINTTARNQILDVIIQEASELLNNPISWENIPNDNRFKILAYFIQETRNITVTPNEMLANINPSSISTVILWNNVFAQLQIDLMTNPAYQSIANTIAQKSAFNIEDNTSSKIVLDYVNQTNLDCSNNYANLFLKNNHNGAINGVVLDGIYLDFPSFVALTTMRMLGDLAVENSLFTMNQEFHVLAINDQYKTAATRIILDVWQNQPLLLNQLAILHKGFQLIQEGIQQNKQNLLTANNGEYGLDYATAKLIMQNVAQYSSIMNQHLSYFKQQLERINIPTKTGQIIAFSGTNTAYYNNLPSITYDVNIPTEENIFAPDNPISDDVLTFFPKITQTDTYVIPHIAVENNVIAKIYIPTDVYTIPKVMINDFPLINEYEFSWQKFLDTNQLNDLFITPTNDMINDNLMCYFDKNISYYNGISDGDAIYVDKWNGNANLNLTEKTYTNKQTANIQIPTENVDNATINDVKKPLYVDVIGGKWFKNVWNQFTWSPSDNQFVYINNNGIENIKWVIDIDNNGFYKIFGYPISSNALNYYYEYMVINNHIVKCKKYNSGTYQNDQILSIEFNNQTYTFYNSVDSNGQPIKNPDTTVLRSLYNKMNEIPSQNHFFQNEMLIDFDSTQALVLHAKNATSVNYNGLKTVISNKSSPYIEKTTTRSEYNGISQQTNNKLTSANTLLQQANNSLKNNDELSSSNITAINSVVNENSRKIYENCFGLLKVGNNIQINNQTLMLSQTRLHERLTSPKARYAIGIVKFDKSNAFKVYVDTKNSFDLTFSYLYDIWTKMLLSKHVSHKFIDWNLQTINKSYYPTYDQATKYLSRYDIKNNPDNLSENDLQQIRIDNKNYYEYIVKGLTSSTNFNNETDALLAFISLNGYIPSADEKLILNMDNYLEEFINQQSENTITLNNTISAAINEQFFTNNMEQTLNEWSNNFISYINGIKSDSVNNEVWLVGQGLHSELTNSSSIQSIISEYNSIDDWMKYNVGAYTFNQPINQYNLLNVAIGENYLLNLTTNKNNWYESTGGKYVKLMQTLLSLNINKVYEIIQYRDTNQSQNDRGILAYINLWAIKYQNIFNEITNVWGYFSEWENKLDHQHISLFPKSDFFNTIYRIEKLKRYEQINYEQLGNNLQLNSAVNQINKLNTFINNLNDETLLSYDDFNAKFNIFNENRGLLKSAPVLYNKTNGSSYTNDYVQIINDTFARYLQNLSSYTLGINNINEVIWSKNINVAQKLIQSFVWDQYILDLMQYCYNQEIIKNIYIQPQKLVSYKYELNENNIWTWSGGYLDWNQYGGISNVLAISDIKLNPVLRISNEYDNNSYYYNGKFYHDGVVETNNLISDYAQTIVDKKAYGVDYFYSFVSMTSDMMTNIDSINAYDNLDELKNYVIENIKVNGTSSNFVDATSKSYSDGYYGNWTDIIGNDENIRLKSQEIANNIRPTIVITKPLLDNNGYMLEKRNGSVMPGNSYDALSGQLTLESEKRKMYNDFSTDNWFLIDNSANDLNNDGSDFAMTTSAAISNANVNINALAIKLYESAVANTLTYNQNLIDLNEIPFSQVVNNNVNGYNAINVLRYHGAYGDNYFVDTIDPSTGEIISTAMENLLNYAYKEKRIIVETIEEKKFVYVYNDITFQTWEELYAYVETK